MGEMQERALERQPMRIDVTPAPANAFLLPLLHMPPSLSQQRPYGYYKGRGVWVLLLPQQWVWLLFLRKFENYYFLPLLSSRMTDGATDNGV